MERLSAKLDGKGVIMLPSGVEHDWCIGTRKVGDVTIQYLSGAAADRLDAYEDTGLTPEAVIDLQERFRALYNEFNDLDLVDPVHFYAFLERVCRWQQAEQSGRLVELPEGKARWLKAIMDERERQDQKWGFPQENTYGEWGSILAEEAGELCKELNELNFGRGDHGKMETEAVHVAAVALSILEHFGVARDVTMIVAASLGRKPAKPKCFYNYDGGEFCMGMAKSINDDEPTEKCKHCWCIEIASREAEAEVSKYVTT